MPDVQARIAPFINVRFLITSEWWEQRGSRYHKGLDLATSPVSSGVGHHLYSMVNGHVIRKAFDGSGYGNYIIMEDDTTHDAFLYGHMYQVDVNEGDSIVVGQQVGIEGTTGSSTGVHLHLEMQNLTNHAWVYNAEQDIALNPCIFMGIPNVKGTWCYYDGTPVPPIPPTPTETKKKKYPWVLYANKLRNRF